MNKLRRKFILAVFLSSAVVFALTVLFTMLIFSVNNTRRADEMTSFIVDNGGELPVGMKLNPIQGSIFGFRYSEESPYRMRYFTVDRNGNIDLSHIASVDEDEAASMITLASFSKHSTGYTGSFRFRKADSITVFLDCTEEFDDARSVLITISVIALLFVAMITVVFKLISKRVMRPFEENSRLQKRFITDASHELKTPLAIISANAEVLAYKDGENEWIKNILSQVERSTVLINELLTLNRLEEIETNTVTMPVDLSGLIKETTDEFSEVFKGKNVSVGLDIKENVTVYGVREQLKRLVSVLVDNAAKYVTEGGRFKVTLKSGARNAVIEMFNTCELDSSVDYSHLFERFYRPDSSRTSGAGGHGVGLSIAKRVVELQKGSIEAKPVSEGLMFRVTLPVKQSRK